MSSDQDKTGMAAAAELYRLAQAQTLIMAAKKNRLPKVDEHGKVVPTKAALALVRRDHPGWAQLAARSNQGDMGNG